MTSTSLPSWPVELFVAGAGDLTEGPRWDEPEGRLRWVDIYPGTLNSVDAHGEARTSTAAGQPLGSFAPRVGGGYVLALETGLALTEDADVSRWKAVGEHRPATSRLRSNDGACDARGRFFAGTMDHDEAPHAGSLWRLDPADPDGTVPSPVEVVTRTTVSNGMGWSPDSSLFYYVDSEELRVDVFDYDVATGTLANRRPFAAFDRDQGLPDGLTVDTEGCLWVAFWGGWAVRRLSPEGDVVGLVELPVPQVSSCTFGGDDYRDLYVTTASYQLSAKARIEQPLAGSIFRCRPGATGSPVRPYAG